MIDFRADLHCHTTCSDGTTSPGDIIKFAEDAGLQGLSITDHDTIAAYPEASLIAAESNISLIPGVEFSAVHRQKSVHILAYSFSVDSPIIKEFCQLHCHRRQERTQAIIKLLTQHGMPLTLDDFPSACTSGKNSSIGRPHIAAALIKKGYVKTIQEAFSNYLKEGMPCFVPSSSISVEETLDIIHKAKGLAIIAHPHLIENVEVLHDLLKMGFDGIEGYYGRLPAASHERWLKIGMRKGWIITGGSDYHGFIKPNQPLGSSWVNYETFSILLNHYLSNKTSG